MEKLHAKTREMKDLLEKSKSYAYQILPAMEEVRAVADQIEVLLGEEVKFYHYKKETEEVLVFYIQGIVEDKTKFSVKLVF